MLFALLTLIALQHPADSSVVGGSVRADVTGAPIAHASIHCLDAGSSTTTDAAGVYALSGLAPGLHHLRFSADGYEPLALDVLLAGPRPVRLDVALARAPTALPMVTVRGERAPAAERAGAAGGDWRATGAELRDSPALGEPDVLRALALSPTAQMTVESSTALHVRGGSADQNLFLLDGVPVYSPVHSGRLPSAFNPDVIDELTVLGAAPPARYGGRLASVVEVRTPLAIGQSFTAERLGPSAFSAAAAAPLVPGVASFLIGARRSYAGTRHGEVAEGALPGSWLDALAKLELRAGRTAISLVAFTADNGLGFPSGHAGRDNRFDWSTTTSALALDRALGSRGALALRVWRARFDAAAAWTPEGRLLTLGNSLDEIGGSGRVSLHMGKGELAGGVEIERPRTRYDVRANDDTVTALLARASSPTIASLFVEEQWRLAGRATLTAGLRGTAASGLAPRLEPRVSGAFDLSPRVTLTAGYARMHQYTQSLRNEESLVSTIFGPDLLLAAGAGGAPVAEADELTAGLTARLGGHTRIGMDWYKSAMRGLALVAPVTADPFATTGFARGRGRASGVGASVAWTGRRLELVGAYGVTSVDRAPVEAEYRVGFAPTQGATLAAALKVWRSTTLRSTLALASERVTTAIDGPLDWDTRDAIMGGREISGTPSRMAGPLNGMQLPSYARLDVGVQHAIPVFHGGTLSGFAAVNNVLARRNLAGYVRPANGPARPLALLPVSLSFGLSWRR
ncbi:MAG TPA: TonB-dependent receptor [Gemmatimonadaceae bacterium]|nr:TonB-dependent receptor [Gemmatimonadaceae bacterium]